MSNSIRVMVERGKKKRVVASAFDWPGWDRSAKTEDDALGVLAAYRHRYAPIADLAGQGDAFAATGDLLVVERLEGTGMTDFYGLSARSAGPEHEQMSEAACERKIALSPLEFPARGGWGGPWGRSAPFPALGPLWRDRDRGI